MANLTGAKVIAQALLDLGVTVLHTLVGIPVADIAEECIDLGIRVVGYRNEQACSYAATAYGYLTGKPGVCLLTGGPGMLHGMAGIGNASANAFPLLVLGGSSESTSNSKGGFQELDHIALLTPHTKAAIRPASSQPVHIVAAIRDAYRKAWYGRPGPAFVDLPTDLIMYPSPAHRTTSRPPIAVAAPPLPVPEPALIDQAAALLKAAKAPLVIVGKGAAYARAEGAVRNLVAGAHLPFLPSPMGKGVVPDSSPFNTSSARSAALKHADVILLLGARLNWIMHFGEAPKYRPDVKIIQVDISAEELGRANTVGEPSVSIWGDIGLVVRELSARLGAWKAFPNPGIAGGSGEYLRALSASADKNERKSLIAATTVTREGGFLTYERAYHLIRGVLHGYSPAEDGRVVYVSEGANTMDISRSCFPIEHPRQRLDAGTWGTMGVGMGYAIASWLAYNLGEKGVVSAGQRKKIVALEGDSAIGFSAMEIETMARHHMDILIIVMNNSGIYKGDTPSGDQWRAKQQQTLTNDTRVPADVVALADRKEKSKKQKGLRSSSLLYETRYEKLAEMVGGVGYCVRTEQELERAVRDGYKETNKVVVINVIIDPGLTMDGTFGWMDSKDKHGGGGGDKSKL